MITFCNLPYFHFLLFINAKERKLLKIEMKILWSELSSKGIEPLMVFNQFFYREPPLPIGSPALCCFFLKVIILNLIIKTRLNNYL
jgi:hypothetical protein